MHATIFEVWCHRFIGFDCGFSVYMITFVGDRIGVDQTY